MLVALISEGDAPPAPSSFCPLVTRLVQCDRKEKVSPDHALEMSGKKMGGDSMQRSMVSGSTRRPVGANGAWSWKRDRPACLNRGAECAFVGALQRATCVVSPREGAPSSSPSTLSIASFHCVSMLSFALKYKSGQRFKPRHSSHLCLSRSCQDRRTDLIPYCSTSFSQTMMSQKSLRGNATREAMWRR